jgi:GMP synthase-like glutamine amidotransferase
MKPIAIFRHFPTEGPGYFASFLSHRRIPFTLIKIDQCDAFETDARIYSGLAFMGGPMSVNDELPWIAPELELIRNAVVSDIPVLGHCLGGQLMAKALGGRVSENSVKEIGWGDVCVSLEGREWFGGVESFECFHWHGETFTLPAGAIHLLSSRYCTNQAFSIGKHLAMQCHVEMTEEMIRVWAQSGAREQSSQPSVQTHDEMLDSLPQRVAALSRVAESVYSRWIDGANL